MADWLGEAARIAPLLAHATPGTWGGEAGVLAAIFDRVPSAAGFAVEFGQRRLGAGTVAALVQRRGWGVLYMDREAGSAPPAAPGQPPVTLARHNVTAGNVSALFARHGVPHELDCLVIDIDSNDYWVWQALDASWRPSLVVIEFNAHVPPGIAAACRVADDGAYRGNKDYGASYAAMSALARAKGYRLVHLHGPWNLYFLREDIPFPAALTVRQPLDEAEFALLTATEPFYDALCGAGRRPSWFGAPPPDVTRMPWEILAPPAAERGLRIADLSIRVLADKRDVTWYQQRKVHEERASRLWPLLRQAGFGTFVDVGASVGYVSLLAARALPDARIVSIEADPRLARLLRTNLRANLGADAARVDLVNAVVGAADAAAVTFSLNPDSTLDNRVAMPGWEQVQLPMCCLDTLLPRLGVGGRSFFKIDTQGFELHVLRGAQRTLAACDDWLLKMEFAPDWLRSQGTDPLELLDHLDRHYEFAEYPERIPWGTLSLDALFGQRIRREEHEAFLEHVKSLAARELGWVDLIVRARR